MTTEDEIKKLQCVVEVLRENRPFRLAVQSIHATRSERIFTNGLNSQGSLIGKTGYNDDKGIYVNPNNSPKSFKPAGKTRETKTKSGKIKFTKPKRKFSAERTTTVKTTFRIVDGNVKKQVEKVKSRAELDRKTRWFQGYKSFRQYIGRRVDVVDLTLFGNLKSNFENRSRGVPSATEISNSEFHVGLDEENSLKAQGQEERYGEIFKHTEEEIKQFYEINALELKNATEKC